MSRILHLRAALLLGAVGYLVASPPAIAGGARGLIAYSKETNRCGDTGCESRVWTVRPNGRARRRLPCATTVKFGCVDVHPIFSPDGRRLATATNGVFEETSDERSKEVLAVRDTTGRILQRIPIFDRPVTGLAWGPGGKQLAYNSFGPLYFVGTDGSESRLFRRTSAHDVAWSRTGRLAWTGRNSRRLFETNRVRTTIRRLPVRATLVKWSPDSRRLAYKTGREERVEVVDANGKRRRTVTRRCDDIDSGVAWSPGGTRILCSSSQGDLLSVSVATGQAKAILRGVEAKQFDWQRPPR